ncbi:MAG TPA: ArsC/Spx/MgsR family protein [Rhodanobacter sp.]
MPCICAAHSCRSRLLEQSGTSARELLCNSETEYLSLGLDFHAIDDAALTAATTAHPKLIERPVEITSGSPANGSGVDHTLIHYESTTKSRPCGGFVVVWRRLDQPGSSENASASIHAGNRSR